MVTDLGKRCNFSSDTFMECKITTWQPCKFSLVFGLMAVNNELMELGM
jgi:hypothetical protein